MSSSIFKYSTMRFLVFKSPLWRKIISLPYFYKIVKRQCKHLDVFLKRQFLYMYSKSEILLRFVEYSQSCNIISILRKNLGDVKRLYNAFFVYKVLQTWHWAWIFSMVIDVRLRERFIKNIVKGVARTFIVIL